MNLTIRHLFFKLPSVQNFLTELLEILSNRQNLIVLLPRGVTPDDLWRALQDRLWHLSFAVNEVSLADLPLERSPVGIMWEVFQFRAAARDKPTLEALLGGIQFYDVVKFSALTELPGEKQQEWLSFLTAWAQTYKSLREKGETPPVFLLIVPEASLRRPLPLSETHLVIQRWWGFPADLEIQLLCRLAYPDGVLDPVTKWREYLLPALEGNDPALVEYLWDSILCDYDELFARLIDFAMEYSWTCKSLLDLGIESLLSTKGGYRQTASLSSPPEKSIHLWAGGILLYDFDHGLELHPGVLAILGKEEMVRHRLWRGQIKLFLPLIDQVRVQVCEILTRAYDSDWPYRWKEPASPEEALTIRDSPLACQLGHLECLFLKAISVEIREFASVPDCLPPATIIPSPGKLLAFISLSGTGSCGGKDFRCPRFKEDGLSAGQTKGHSVEKTR